MLNKNYQVESHIFNLTCEIEEYCDILEKRMSMFEETENSEFDSYLKIKEEQTETKFKGTIHTIYNHLIKTDLYPLLNNTIANLILDEKNILSHSAVLCYNGQGILIIGNFSSGKTTLCLEGMKKNLSILSTDQSILTKEGEKLFLIRGSKYLRVRESEDQLIKNNTLKTEIKLILNIQGLCENGQTNFEPIENEYHRIKAISKSFTWHADFPLFTNNSLIYIDRVKVKKWLENIQVPIYNIRGNKEDVISIIKEKLK